MSMGKKIKLLDCTLRDGGFINDWNFGRDEIINIFERSISAGTDIIEVGFIDDRQPGDPDRTMFPDALSVNDAFGSLSRGSSMIVGMIDFGTCSIDRIIPCKDSVMDGIRVIFKKKDRFAALDFCAKLKALGYEVFVQPVSITGYSDEEMTDLIRRVNELHPHAMSMVDTYGLLHEGGLLHYYELMDSNLDTDISIGYHAHNNFQLGYSNCIALIERNEQKKEDERHTLVVDGSAFGMGKGAGNTPIELLAMYMNKHHGGTYDINQMLETIDVSIMEIYLKLPWGYSLKYYLAASNDCHPKYVQHLMQKRCLSIKSINEILDTIDAKEKLAYNAEHIEELYHRYQTTDRDEKGDMGKLSEALKSAPLLVIGPARSIKDESDKVKDFILKNKPVIITINYLPEDYYTDYIFISNSKRYLSLEGRLAHMPKEVKPPVLIATSNVTRAKGDFDYRVDYEGLLDQSFEIKDNSLIMLLTLVNRFGVKEVNLAGFDGYSTSVGENYFNVAMEYAFIKEKAQALNEYANGALKRLSEDMKINFVTRTRYKY